MFCHTAKYQRRVWREAFKKKAIRRVWREQEKREARDREWHRKYEEQRIAAMCSEERKAYYDDQYARKRMNEEYLRAKSSAEEAAKNAPPTVGELLNTITLGIFDDRK